MATKEPISIEQTVAQTRWLLNTDSTIQEIREQQLFHLPLDYAAMYNYKAFQEELERGSSQV